MAKFNSHENSLGFSYFGFFFFPFKLFPLQKWIIIDWSVVTLLLPLQHLIYLLLAQQKHLQKAYPAVHQFQSCFPDHLTVLLLYDIL